MTIICRPFSEEETQIVLNGLNEYTAGCEAPAFNQQPFGLIKHDDAGEIIGGLVGTYQWNWLYVDLLWVHKDYRRKGLGKELLMQAETWARENGLTGFYLTTQSWEGRGFYTKMGLKEYAEFNDYPPGYSRYCFRKYL